MKIKSANCISFSENGQKGEINLKRIRMLQEDGNLITGWDLSKGKEFSFKCHTAVGSTQGANRLQCSQFPNALKAKPANCKVFRGVAK